MIALLLLACSGEKGVSTPGTETAGDSAPLHTDETADSAEPSRVCAEQRGDPLTGDVCVTSAPCTWEGEQSYEYFGWLVSSGEDVDGDGLDDVIVAAPVWDAPSSDGLGADAGRVLLISGAGLREPGDGVLSTVYGVGYAENLGTNLALVGDVNGDGFADALLGAHGDDVAAENAGAAWLVLGDASGWTEGPVDGAAATVWYGESEYARVGRSLAGGADIDGDGLDDMVLGGELSEYDGEDEGYREGRAYLMLGSAAPAVALADADAIQSGPDSYGGTGKASALGDLNGDGYADTLIGAPYGDSYRGCAYALPGSADHAAWSAPLTEAAQRLDGEASYDVFSWLMSAADLDGDGFDELVVGAPLSDRSDGSAGAVWIYAGAADFMDGPEAVAILDGPWEDWQLGSGLSSGGDMNGDGRDELLVGAVAAYTGLHTKTGRFYLFEGSDTPPAAVDEADAVLHGAAVKDYLGGSSAFGDLDGDGRADLIVASGYTNTDEAYDIGSARVFWGR